MRANTSPMHSSVVAVRTFAASFTRFGQSGVFADDKQPLAKAFEQRTDLFQFRSWACGENEQFACFCEVRVPEHRSGDVPLAMARMLLGDAAGHGGTDRARRNVDRIWRENARQTLGPERHRR